MACGGSWTQSTLDGSSGQNVSDQVLAQKCLVCMPYVCRICMPCMYTLCVYLIFMSVQVSRHIQYVFLMCMPYKDALYV